MIDAHEFLLRVRLGPDALDAWIAAGWLMPHRDAAGWRFSDVDIARARLICDLRQDLGVSDDGVTVILELLDQIHGLRRALRSVVSALGAQPEQTRRHIADDVRDVAGLSAGSSARQHPDGR
jgi:chaperone modulatory protein CbpM